MPGLGSKLFSVKHAARIGVVSMFDRNNPSLAASKLTFPLQAVGHDIYSSSLDLTRGGNVPKLAMQTAANANLWHRRLEHLNNMI